MSSNYEWQKHQARERVTSRLQDAAAHRRAKQAGGRAQPARSLRLTIIALGLGAVVAILFLSACTTDTGRGAVGPEMEPPAMEEEATFVESGVLADRILFQDERDKGLKWETGQLPSSYATKELTMGERIRFQDLVWESTHRE